MGKATIAVLLALAVFGGCVELDGQRISMRYDAAADRLELLLFYDGIHDSGSDGDGKAAEQIREALANGEFLLLDWPLHFERGKLVERLQEKGKFEGPERELVEYLTKYVDVKPLGHYRDPEGRIGAAQAVTFRNASVMFRKINALLNQTIREDEPDREIARTVAKMVEPAGKGEQWIRLDGHSIVMEVPVHLPEWQVLKSEIAKGFMRDPDFDDEEKTRHFLVQLLSTTPFTVIETPEKLSFRLGAKNAPSTFRYRIRESKKTGLDEVVVNAVSRDLDVGLAANLLGDAIRTPRSLAAVLRWGPPEEKARALLRTIRSEERAERKASAVKLLKEFGVRWNKEIGIPAAPKPMKDEARWIEAWTKWYGRVLRFPGGEKEEKKSDAENLRDHRPEAPVREPK